MDDQASWCGGGGWDGERGGEGSRRKWRRRLCTEREREFWFVVVHGQPTDEKGRGLFIDRGGGGSGG